MDSRGSPECLQPVRAHEERSARALDFCREHTKGGSVPVRGFLGVVSAWSTGHTLGADQSLRGEPKDKAAKASAWP